MKYIKSYFAVLITFLVADLIWIAVFAGGFYQQQLGSLLKATPDYLMVGVFYLFYAAGLVYLVVMNAKSSVHSMLAGAVLGALAYGTYTISNYSLIEGWAMPVVVTDVLWGAVVTAISAFAGFHFYIEKQP